MAFSENLQYLRTSRGLTQERLAVLLGVSRQAISKYESDRAYPEMDKLITLCELFDCTLDDLVTGDLRSRFSPIGNVDASLEATGRESGKSLGVVPFGHAAAQDYTGYDAHMRSFAWKIAAGVAAIITGSAFAALVDGWADSSAKDLVQFLAIACGVVAGLGFLIPAALNKASFHKAHPYVEDFYTDADRSRGIRELAATIVGGIALILGGIAASMLGEAIYGQEDGWWTSAVLFGSALGVGLLIWGGIRYVRFNIDGYNRDRHKETDAASRAKAARVGRICAIIMLVSTIVGLAALFLAAPWASSSTIARAILTNFWMAWVIGGIACAIAALLFRDNAEK